MKSLLFLIVFILATTVAQYEFGHCKLRGTSWDSGITGDVYFFPSSTPGNYMVYADISGITQNLNGSHGMHVHEFGDLTGSTAATCGSHYKGPGNGTHGCPETSPIWDEGDMGNWNVDENGNVLQTKELSLLALSGMYSIIGRAVVLHNKTDDCTSVSSAGNRLAYCVIGIANPTSVPASFNVTSFNNTASSPGAAGVAGNTVSYDRATCVLTPLNNGTGVSGTVVFIQDANGVVTVTASVNGLMGAAHAIHIHVFGDLTSKDGSQASTHYNPNGAAHALPPTLPRHVGDAGNICTFDDNGVAWYQAAPGLLSLNDSLANIVGRSVILHAGVDTGGSTYGCCRIAECVIGWANSTLAPSPVPTNIAAPECQSPVFPPGATTTTTTATTAATTTASATTSAATTATTATASTTSSGTTSQPAATTGAASSVCGGLLVVVASTLLAVFVF